MILPHAIRTGSWLAREALTDARGFVRHAATICAIVVALLPFSSIARLAHSVPYPRLDWPLEITGSQYAPLAWSDVAGWKDDDHLQAYNAFRASCKSIAAQQNSPGAAKALSGSLLDPCRIAKVTELTDGAKARAFFEEHFQPLQISRLGEDAGFVTGYYEPIIDGSRIQTDVYNVPVYRRPSNLFVRGFNQESAGLPNGGQVYPKIGRRKLVPYYDRAQIEDGAIAGRGLEICWLKNQTDLLFAQIQGRRACTWKTARPSASTTMRITDIPIRR